jgi:integrase
MASLSTEAHGGRQVQFIDLDGKRRSIRLGRIPTKQAEAIVIRIEALVAARHGNTATDPQTAAWVKNLGDTLHERLARVGLVSPRCDAHLTLSAMFDRYFASLTIKASTERTYQLARTAAENHFGKDRALSSITPADGECFKRALRDAGYAQATTAKYVKVTRQMFAKALKFKLIEDNPLAGVKAGSQTNATRLRFISVDTIARVLEACPDNEWRLLVALSRFGGLRCPSEHLALRWDDIDWKRGRVTVRSPKTAGNANQETREIPLFPELAPYLSQARDEAPKDFEFVISDRHRKAERKGRLPVNLGTQLKRIVRRAGFTPWPRIWHNLRASRQTELNARFPLHVVCEWLGNTPAVAAASYLMVRESDFEAATDRDKKAVQNPVQQAAELARTERQR